MLSWKLFSQHENSHTWNDLISQFNHYGVYQSYEWGEYKKSFGWKPYRFIATDSNSNILIAFQGLVKTTFLGMGMLWINGGPLGDLSFLDQSFIQKIKEVLGIKKLNVKISPNEPFSEKSADDLQRRGWNPCQVKLWNGQSLIINPSLSEEELKLQLSKNWRHNLNRSKKYNLKIDLWENPDLEQILAIYNEMEKIKNLSAFFTLDKMINLYNSFQNNIIIVRCRNQNNELLGLRACVYTHTKALDILAATNKLGRDTYSSYLLFWSLMNECRTKKIDHYDMAGIDIKSNPGVSNFKKGTGAKPITFLGEWDWCSSKILKTMIDIKIRFQRPF